MSGLPTLSLPLRQALKKTLPSKAPPRCLHTRPPTLPTRPHHLKPSHILRQHRRHFAKDSTRSIRGNARILFKNHPIQMSLALSFIAAGVVGLIYVNYIYQTYIIGAYHNFPEEVAKKLRRAIYYTKTDLNANEAVKYYRQALQVAEEIGMDPMSDEVMGIKIEVAGLMERIHNYGKAIEVLERVRADNLKWLEMFGGREDLKKKRTHVLGKTVAVNTKLAEHYSNPAIWDRDMAEERLVWAVETVYKEKLRRDNENVTIEDEGRWMTDNEIGAATEALAQNYADKDQHHLAVPLYLQCLRLKETTDCHDVILMSNLATSLAQQSPRAARAVAAYAESTHIHSDPTPTGPVATHETMIENAKLWAQKALTLAQQYKPPQRNEECDVGCVVATHNLGELAEMTGDKEGAMVRYKEAVGLARAIGFEEGVERSSQRLRELLGKK